MSVTAATIDVGSVVVLEPAQLFNWPSSETLLRYARCWHETELHLHPVTDELFPFRDGALARRTLVFFEWRCFAPTVEFAVSDFADELTRRELAPPRYEDLIRLVSKSDELRIPSPLVCLHEPVEGRVLATRIAENGDRLLGATEVELCSPNAFGLYFGVRP